MRDFHMNENTAMKFPLARAFALAAFHVECNPFAPAERSSPGYIAQEAARLNARSNGSTI
jgi:hypothetical protein